MLPTNGLASTSRTAARFTGLGGVDVLSGGRHCAENEQGASEEL